MINVFVLSHLVKIKNYHSFFRWFMSLYLSDWMLEVLVSWSFRLHFALTFSLACRLFRYRISWNLYHFRLHRMTRHLCQRIYLVKCSIRLPNEIFSNNFLSSWSLATLKVLVYRSRTLSLALAPSLPWRLFCHSICWCLYCLVKRLQLHHRSGIIWWRINLFGSFCTLLIWQSSG